LGIIHFAVLLKMVTQVRGDAVYLQAELFGGGACAELPKIELLRLNQALYF
jgi:hypothetical protein